MRERLTLFFKGMAMGAADVVPGVSGGTIAFITGIYETLINALGSFDRQVLRMLLNFDIKGAWQHVNGPFLLVLIAGIFSSILLLANLIHWLLLEHPIPLWSFFLGLILVSVYLLGRATQLSQPVNLIAFILAALLAWQLTRLTGISVEPSISYLFFCGMLAICAMVLPGISGSFILLLLGAYEPVIAAIKDFDLTVIGVFAAGAIIGLLSFTHLLSWLLKRYHQLTLATLTGFMLGSIGKVWPWKSVSVDAVNLMPSSYASQTGQDPMLLLAVMLFAVGALVGLGMGRLGDDRA